MSGTSKSKSTGSAKKSTTTKPTQVVMSQEVMENMVKSIMDSVTPAQSDAQRVVVEMDGDNRKNYAHRSNQAIRKAQAQQSEYIMSIRNAKKKDLVTITIDEIYREYLGTMRVMNNGAVIYLKADGRPITVHKVFLPAIRKKLKHISTKVARMKASQRDARAGVTEYSR